MHSYKIEYSMDTPSASNISFVTVGNVISGISLRLEGITLDVISSLVISANHNSIKMSGITMRILNMLKENSDPATVIFVFPVVLLYKFYVNAMVNVYNVILTLNYDISLFVKSNTKMKKILNEHYIEDISNIILEYGTYGPIGEIVLNTTDTVNTHARYTEYEVILCANTNFISLDLKKDSFNNIVIAFVDDGKFINILDSCTLDNNTLPVATRNNIYTITDTPKDCSLLTINITPQKQIMLVHIITY
jgi:hypothetical protein